MKLDKQSAFPPFQLNGRNYDLSHLNAHIVDYVQPALGQKTAMTYRFYVSYSMHCFTKAYAHQSEAEKQALMYVAEKEARPFCVERYQFSKYLPDIIKNLANAKIGFAGYDNFATIEIMDEKQIKRFYKVAFVMYRFQKKLRLHISSAYPIEKWEKLKPVGFFKLAHNLLQGKSLPKPYR
ncbi:hypothetical protein [Lonepinella koalarum]|uniref:hypothetical protein n=1 Tax=Lonepinella koalarum TaxID=53417 RepID=UPI003F6DAFC2